MYYKCNIKNTRVCPLRVRRFVHWATAARPIDFVLCSVFMSSWQRIIDSAFAFTTLLPSVERQCPHCLLVTTFLFSRIGSYSSDASVISKMCASRIRTRVCPLRVRRFVHWATAERHIDFMLCSVFMSSWQRIIDSAFAFTTGGWGAVWNCRSCDMQINHWKRETK